MDETFWKRRRIWSSSSRSFRVQQFQNKQLTQLIFKTNSWFQRMSRSRKHTPYSSRQNSRSSSPALPQSLEDTPLLSSDRPPTPSFAVTSYHSHLKSTDSLEVLQVVSKQCQTISSSFRARQVYTQTDEQNSSDINIPIDSIGIQTDSVFIDTEDLAKHSDLTNIFQNLEDIKKSQSYLVELIKKNSPRKVTFSEELSDNLLEVSRTYENNINKIQSFIKSTLGFYQIPIYIITFVTLLVTIIIKLHNSLSN